MDKIDTDLLAALRRDARTPAAALARKLGISRSTVQARIERLEVSGVIAGYTVIEGADRARRRLHATVLISVEPKESARVTTAMAAMHEVESLHTTSGRFDMCAEVSAEDAASLDAVLDRVGMINGVRSIETLVQLSAKIDRRRP
ncbi:MAG: Lrp/AsnC family transcriptional regulator [Pikeienuella sp.]